MGFVFSADNCLVARVREEATHPAFSNTVAAIGNRGAEILCARERTCALNDCKENVYDIRHSPYVHTRAQGLMDVLAPFFSLKRSINLLYYCLITRKKIGAPALVRAPCI